MSTVASSNEPCPKCGGKLWLLKPPYDDCECEACEEIFQIVSPPLFTKEEPARSDTARLDWMEKMRADCEGHVLSRCFIPGSESLRENIDELMKLNPL